MKRMLKGIVALAAAAVLVSGAQAAGEFSMWFGDAAGNEISTLSVDAGAAFDVNVWMSTTIDSYMFSAAIAFDTANGSGTAAAKLDNKIAPATGVANSDIVLGSGISGIYDGAMTKAFSGFSGSGARPYGVDISRENTSMLASPFTSTLVATLHLKNNMAAGENYAMSIYDAGANDSLTTYLMDTEGTIFRGVTDTLSVNTPVVPEPGSLMALGVGVMGLAGFAFKKRA